MESNYLIRLKFRDKLEFIYFSENDLEYENFLKKAFSTFRISEAVSFKVKLVDAINTIIHPSCLKDVITQYHRHERFFVEIIYEVNFTNTAKIVTPFLISEFFIKSNKDWILLENKQNDSLSEYARQQLVSTLCHFMWQFFSSQTITKSQKIMTITAALQIFPSLQSQNDKDGGVSILLGYIENRLKYESNKSKKQKVKLSENTTPIQDAEIVNAPDMGALINSMKSIVITSKEDMDIIKANLEKTRDYRRSLLANSSIDLMETFPFFFICPQLIAYEFEKQFPDIISTAFIENWDKYCTALSHLLESQYSTSMFYTNWPEDIENLLVLLKLLPSSKVGKNALAKRDAFNKASERLFVYFESGTPPTELKKVDNLYPYIIAYGQTKNKIDTYYIEIEKHLIQVPIGFNAIQTFDLFFKAHKIFNLSFDKNIANAMHFIQYYIYKMSENGVKMTPRMEDINNRIIRYMSTHA